MTDAGWEYSGPIDTYLAALKLGCVTASCSLRLSLYSLPEFSRDQPTAHPLRAVLPRRLGLKSSQEIFNVHTFVLWADRIIEGR